MNFVDNTIDLPWWNFSSNKIWDRVAEGNTLIFGDTRISLQHSGRKFPYQNQLDPFSRFYTTLVCDRRTDIRRQHIPRYCIQWHGEGVFVTICHYTNTRRHPQNRKFMMYCSAATGVPSNSNGHRKKLWEFWRSGFDIGAYVCNRHTDTEIETYYRDVIV